MDTEKPRSRLRTAIIITAIVFGLGGVVAVVVLLPYFDIPGGYPPEPVFEYSEDFAVKRTTADGTQYSVNNSTATFDLDVNDPDEHCEHIFTNYASAIDYCRTNGLALLPSVHLVQGKCKQSDDSVCSALEAAVQQGITGASFGGKRKALANLLSKLRELRSQPDMPSAGAPAFDAAIVHVAAALSLGGMHVALSSDLTARVGREKDAFLADMMQSRPIGFWDESEELRAIFRQDRFLMRGIRFDGGLDPAVAIAVAFHVDAALLRDIESLLRLDSVLTNPVTHIDTERIGAPQATLVGWRQLVSRVAAMTADVSDARAAATPALAREICEEFRAEYGQHAGLALVAYSRSKEYALLQSLQPDVRPTDLSSTMQLLIDAVRSGRLSLEPTEDSGWYDYQLHALETLLLPERGRESAKLQFSDAYKERLHNAFATVLSKERETHIKHLPLFYLGFGVSPPVSPPVVRIGPEFSVEPTATVYLRLARGYRFLRDALAAILGADGLRNIQMNDLDNASVSGDLARDLDRASELMYGLYETVCFEVGQRSQYLDGEMPPERILEAKAIATQWLSSLGEDADLAADTRFAVAIMQRPGGQVRYWATCGVRLQRVVYEYAAEPKIGGGIEPVLVPTPYYAPTDMFAEFEGQSGPPLTRKEFRAICDSARDEAELLRVLGAAPPPVRGYASLILGFIGMIFVGAACAVGYRCRGRVKRLELRRRLAPYLTRRNRVIATGILGGILLLWFLALVLLPGYRLRFFVRHLAARHSGLGIVCETRLIPHMHPRHAVPALVELLGDPDPQVRYLAARFLKISYRCMRGDADRCFTGEAMSAALQSAATDPVVDVAIPVTATLSAIKTPQNVEFLLKRLPQTRNIDTLCAATLEALGTIGDPRAVEAALPFSSDPRSLVSWVATKSLSHYDDPRAVARVRELILSADRESRGAALAGLEESTNAEEPFADKRFDDALLAGAIRSAVGPRHRLAMARLIRDPSARAEAFLAIIREPSEEQHCSRAECSKAAAYALRTFGQREKDAVSTLTKALKDPEPGVQDAAAAALKNIRDQ